MGNRETKAGIAALSGVASGAATGNPYVAGGMALVGGLASYFGGDNSGEEERLAAELKTDKERQTAMWTSAIANNDKVLYGDGTPENPGLLNKYADFKKKQVDRGVVDKKEVTDRLTAFEGKYLPVFSDMAASAQTATKQLSDIAGTYLGDSKSYLNQLQMGTKALNARLSSQGLLRSSSGNAQFAEFTQNLGAQAEASREQLLGKIQQTGLMAMQQAAQISQYGTNTIAGLNQQQRTNELGMEEFGTQQSMNAATLTSNTKLGIGGQMNQQQGLTSDQLDVARKRGDQMDVMPYQIMGSAGDVASKGLETYGKKKSTSGQDTRMDLRQ